MQRRGLGLAPVRAGQPALGRAELGAAQQEAAVAALALPLDRLDQPAGVLARVLEVGLERVHEPLDAVVEARALVERDPVALPHPLGHLLVGDPAAQQRHDALAQLERVLDLLLAEARGDRVRADDEHEPVAALDRGPQRGREDLGVANALDVDPDVLPPLAQRAGEALHELGITARVGEEDVRHRASLRAAS